MAYMTQEMKKELAPNIRKILKKYDAKGTLSINHHTELILTIKSSPFKLLDGDDQYSNVNVYHIDKHYDGKARDFINEVHDAMMVGNYDKSDIMSDYFNVGWYTDIRIGTYDNPYKMIG